ncbi:MAG: peroxiredoxin [Betaproteobacteria bacterium]|jgi:peroxiredoxin Q/BCP|nr:peroxiredoxin [Betaproteobacteria bacterium]
MTRLLLTLTALGALCMIKSALAEPVVGKAAPEFALPDAGGKLHRLADQRGRWVVLYFYPKNDTPGCTTEACNLRDRHQELTRLGATLYGVSVDSPASHAEFARKHSLPFTLLADEKGEVAKAYNSLLNLIVFKMARRNTFLVAPDGTLHKAWIGVDPAVHADELVQTLRALQARDAGSTARPEG